MGISTELNTGLITFSKVFHRLVENFAHRPGISKKPLEKAVDNLTDKQRNTQRCGLFVENCQGEFIFSVTWRFLPPQKYAILQKYV